MRLPLLIGLLFGPLGCEADPIVEDDEPRRLVEAEAWQPASVESDRFADQRPPDVECEVDRGYHVAERGDQRVFEVNTGWCNYITVTQPLLEPLDAGDEIEVRVFHFELTAAEPAQGYVAVALGDAIVWERAVPIPSASGLLQDVFAVTTPVEAGASIQFHVHNHGLNSWEIVSISRL